MSRNNLPFKFQHGSSDRRYGVLMLSDTRDVLNRYRWAIDRSLVKVGPANISMNGIIICTRSRARHVIKAA
jgi:hypothetical protein